MDSTDSMDILKFRMELFDNSWNGTSCWREMDWNMKIFTEIKMRLQGIKVNSMANASLG